MDHFWVGKIAERSQESPQQHLPMELPWAWSSVPKREKLFWKVTRVRTERWKKLTFSRLMPSTLQHSTSPLSSSSSLTSVTSSLASAVSAANFRDQMSQTRRLHAQVSQLSCHNVCTSLLRWGRVVERSEVVRLNPLYWKRQSFHAWTSLLEGYNGSYLPNCQTNLDIVGEELSLLF